MTEALTSLQADHDTFTAHFDRFSPDARLWRPAPDQWSAMDVMEHLVRVETGLLFGLNRQLRAGEQRRDVGVPSPEALTALRAFLRSDRRTRVPESAAKHIVPQGDDYETIRATWNELPDRWRETLHAVPDALAETGLVSHPRAGALTARGAAQFAADHTAHHTRQLLRLEDAEGFPDGA